jgi:hypothetical protein
MTPPIMSIKVKAKDKNNLARLHFSRVIKKLERLAPV